MMERNKETLEKLILIEDRSYREVGRLFGVSDAMIKKVASRFGIELPVRKNMPEGFTPHNKTVKKKRCCKYCGEEFVLLKPSSSKTYCSTKCSSLQNSLDKYNRKVSEDGEERCINGMRLKPFILKEQSNICAICGMLNEWNGKVLIFVLDHINGNAAKNSRSNLRLICPNCDSQLDTFKSKNKNSARKR